MRGITKNCLSHTNPYVQFFNQGRTIDGRFRIPHSFYNKGQSHEPRWHVCDPRVPFTLPSICPDPRIGWLIQQQSNNNNLIRRVNLTSSHLQKQSKHHFNPPTHESNNSNRINKHSHQKYNRLQISTEYIMFGYIKVSSLWAWECAMGRHPEYCHAKVHTTMPCKIFNPCLSSNAANGAKIRLMPCGSRVSSMKDGHRKFHVCMHHSHWRTKLQCRC